MSINALSSTSTSQLSFLSRTSNSSTSGTEGMRGAPPPKPPEGGGFASAIADALKSIGIDESSLSGTTSSTESTSSRGLFAFSAIYDVRDSQYL